MVKITWRIYYCLYWIFFTDKLMETYWKMDLLQGTGQPKFFYMDAWVISVTLIFEKMKAENPKLSSIKLTLCYFSISRSGESLIRVKISMLSTILKEKNNVNYIFNKVLFKFRYTLFFCPLFNHKQYTKNIYNQLFKFLHYAETSNYLIVCY